MDECEEDENGEVVVMRVVRIRRFLLSGFLKGLKCLALHQIAPL